MLQNIASTKCCKIVGLRNYQREGNLKMGEVNFERGGSDPLEIMRWGYNVGQICISKIGAHWEGKRLIGATFYISKSGAHQESGSY